MRYRTPVLSVVALSLVAGCGADSNVSNPLDTTAGGTEGTFVLSEFKIALDGALPAGQVTVTIDNQGSETHELVVAAADNVETMPMKSDGSVDEDKIPEADKVGEVEDIAGQTSTTKTFTLEPGTYVAFCNIVDEMGMAGDTAAGSDNMPVGGGPDSTMMMGGASGHVHFAEGMYMTFTVE